MRQQLSNSQRLAKSRIQNVKQRTKIKEKGDELLSFCIAEDTRQFPSEVNKKNGRHQKGGSTDAY